MASDGERRSGLLTAGGVLSIIAGALEVIGGLMIGVLTVGISILARLAHLPLRPDGWFDDVNFIPLIPFWLLIVGVPLIVLGVVAIVGGIWALRRKCFGLSLAGAICALPSSILGILAIIFVCLSKREFQAKG